LAGGIKLLHKYWLKRTHKYQLKYFPRFEPNAVVMFLQTFILVKSENSISELNHHSDPNEGCVSFSIWVSLHTYTQLRLGG